MPKKWFRCPDGEVQEIEECMKSCRMERRCAPMPYLRMAGEERKWKGKPSVTMLNRCIRQTWLQFREDYVENPDGNAFRILGTGTHANMESHVTDEDAETFVSFMGLTGIYDLVEEDNGVYELIDHKTTGAYAVKKMLGISEIGQAPVLDQDGNQVFYTRNSKYAKAGDPKTKKIYGPVPEKADTSQHQEQLNLYKIAWEKAHPGKVISKLTVFAIVRDGGTVTAKGYGVLRNTYMIDIPFLPEEALIKQSKERRDRIISAMKSDEVPPMGSYEQLWEGRFCQSYCPVANYCKKIGDNPYLSDYE